jgi:diaminopimelate decarboxylase
MGVHFHIGSQIDELKVFEELAQKATDIYHRLLSKDIEIQHINLGGGLGIDYINPDKNPIALFKNYFDCIKNNLSVPEKVQIHFELGRSIVGQCGSLITKVLYIKKSTNKEFAVVDAGMTELIRPALYGAVHAIENITSELAKNTVYTVVGPICESSDTFANDLYLPLSKRGDYLAIRSAGAYGEVMSSNYNLRPKNDPLYI